MAMLRLEPFDGQPDRNGRCGGHLKLGDRWSILLHPMPVEIWRELEAVIAWPDARDMATPVNWDLLESFRARPHRLHNHNPARYPEHADLPEGVGEVMGEALAAHHLLDLAGVPNEHQRRQPDVTDLDARVFRLVVASFATATRLDRISSLHQRQTGPGGTFDDFCAECGDPWPCLTRRIADGLPEEPGDGPG